MAAAKVHHLDRPGNGFSLWDYWVRHLVDFGHTIDRFARELDYAAREGAAYRNTGRHFDRLNAKMVDAGQSYDEHDLLGLLQQNLWDEEDLFSEFTDILRLELQCAFEAGDEIAATELLSEIFGPLLVVLEGGEDA